MSYSQLLQHIKSIQSVFDKEPSSPDSSQKPSLPALILKICYAEAMIIDVKGGKILADSEVESWLETLEILGKVSDFNLETSLVNYLPNPGSEDWLKLAGFVNRMIEGSEGIYNSI
ncbi:hypothetical protein DFH28DRAFT_1164513 [Melampsora americana]|nr:hypothetical protein DFH28DRAFT_1164513 [Melampsora americana]